MIDPDSGEPFKEEKVMKYIYVYEGTVKVEQSTGKVYLVSGDSVIDLNSIFAEMLGDEVMITVTPPEEGKVSD